MYTLIICSMEKDNNNNNKSKKKTDYCYQKPFTVTANWYHMPLC
jgi:hypothetical protein